MGCTGMEVDTPPPKSTIGLRATNAVGKDMTAREHLVAAWGDGSLLGIWRGQLSTSSFSFDKLDSSCSKGGAGSMVGSGFHQSGTGTSRKQRG